MAATSEGLETLFDTAAFRMYCMKVLPCPQRFSHDWTECPFAHPGERATRRAPHKFGYTGVACPSMKRDGSCAIGSHCPYSHNVFEYWLHPTRYRTQLCSDGSKCPRKICFFAHSIEELRTPETKPWVAPEAVVAAAAAAAAERERRSPTAPGPASPRGPPHTPETEVEGHFTAEQAATLLRHLLPPGALANLTTELRDGQGGAGDGGVPRREPSAPLCHSDPLGLRRTPARTDVAVRHSLGAAPAPAYAPHPLLAGAAQQAQQQPEQAVAAAGDLAAIASHLAAVAEAQRMLDAALAAAVVPPPSARAMPLSSPVARPAFAAPAGQPGHLALSRRASLDARQEARLCAGYATVRMQQQAAPSHSGAGQAPTHPLLPQQPPPHWQPLVHAGGAYGATYQLDELLQANSWPASAGPAPGQAVQAAGMGRTSMDSCLDSGLFASMGSVGAGSEAGLPRLSVDSRLSMDATLAQYGADGRPSMDSTTSIAALAMERFSQEMSRLSQDLGRMSFEGSGRPPPPPTANPYTSSLFASAPPCPGASDGSWQAGGQPRGPA